jgi:hypothetical protein
MIICRKHADRECVLMRGEGCIAQDGDDDSCSHQKIRYRKRVDTLLAMGK